MKDLGPVFSKMKEMEIEGASLNVVVFLEKLEVYVSRDIH
jgi:hypothetical protein